jgi:hypothetical protein
MVYEIQKNLEQPDQKKQIDKGLFPTQYVFPPLVHNYFIYLFS